MSIDLKDRCEKLEELARSYLELNSLDLWAGPSPEAVYRRFELQERIDHLNNELGIKLED